MKSYFRKNFLQSEEWRKFQESFGRQTFSLRDKNFCLNIIEHKLLGAGKYFYIPRPDFNFLNSDDYDKVKKIFSEIFVLTRKNNSGWIRFDAEDEKTLNFIKKNIGYKIVKAPHDMQPKEIFVLDISRSEEEILAEMKPKTRYNIKLSQRRGVSVKVISYFQFSASKQFSNSKNPNDKNKIKEDKNIQEEEFYFNEFWRLVKITSKRNGIKSHPKNYYQKMFEIIPPEIIKLYVAEYQGKVVAANIMIFYIDTAIYLHGASDDKYKNLMATYLLQWQAIKDAKKAGCDFYDFGGVKINSKLQSISNDWQGITRFKLGFSRFAIPLKFLGSYDLIIDRRKYFIYQTLRKIKSILF